MVVVVVVGGAYEEAEVPEAEHVRGSFATFLRCIGPAPWQKCQAGRVDMREEMRDVGEHK